jgi:hypothetical protein
MRFTMRGLLTLLSLSTFSSVSGLSASLSARVGSSVCQRLSGVEITSVANKETLQLTSQWRDDQRCVVEFLRHFG